MDNPSMGVMIPLAGLVLYLVSLFAAARFLLQATQVDAYNPISQQIIRLTNPVLAPLRTLLPSQGRVDLASLVALWLLQVGQIALIREPAFSPLVFGGLVQTVDLFANAYFLAMIVVVVLSFVAPVSSHPGAVLLRQVTEPLLAPVRRVIPPMGGLDFSVMVVLFVLIFVRGNLLPWLGGLTGL